MAETQTLNWEQTLFTVILHAGNARSKAVEAAELAQNGKFDESEAALKEAEAEQMEAHKVQTQIIQMEAGGEHVPFSVLLIHSMDLLLLSWAEMDHARQMIAVSKRLSALELEAKKWRK